MTQYILPITSDWHVNDIFALSPPTFHRESGDHHASKLQRALYSAWKDYWSLISKYKSRLDATVIAPAMGDLGDLNRHSQSSLITSIKSEVQSALLDVLRPAERVVDHWVILRGTESHSGAAGELEEWLAHDLDNAIPFSKHVKSWYVWKAQIEGVRLHCAHHLPSGTKLVGNRGEAVARSCRYLADEYIAAGEKRPDLAFWGHRHWFAPGWNKNIQGYCVSSWGSLNSFGRKIGLSIPGPIQTPILFIPGLSKGERWSIKVFERMLPAQKTWTPNSLKT